MLIDMAQAVGGYLHDVFVGTADWGILVGYIAQAMFAMRFVVQWIASERAGRSVVPTAFWVFSIGGGLMLLGYALYRKDPVFILGQVFGVFVYLRNLQFVMRSGSTTAVAELWLVPGCELRGSACHGGHGLESPREVGKQILGIFQADVEADRRSARGPFGSGPVLRAVEQYRQALETTP